MKVFEATFSPEEALEYIAFAVLVRHLPEHFQGDFKCELDEDGNVYIIVEDDGVPKDQVN